MRDRKSDRAVSVTTGYVLNLAVATLLVGGLLVAGGSIIESQTERVAESELDVAGQQLAGNLMSADRLARTDGRNNTSGGEVDTAVVTVDLPVRTVGESYRISIDDGTIELRTTDPDVTVTVAYWTTLTVNATDDLRGGSIVIEYVDGSENENGTLEVRNA